MEIKNLRIVDKGALKATFEVYIPTWGLHILCNLMDKSGSKWVGMPSRPFEKDGQTKYQWLTWFDKENHKKFEEACIRLIDAGQYEKAEDRSAQPEQGKPQMMFGSINSPAMLADDIPF